MKVKIKPSIRAVREYRISNNLKAMILQSDDKNNFDKLIDNIKDIEDVKQILKAIALLIKKEK